MGADVGESVGIGVGAIDGSGDGAGVGENVSTETDKTDADDIERRRLAASSAEADPSRRWLRAVVKSMIAAVRVPSATDALSTLVTYCYASIARAQCIGRWLLDITRDGAIFFAPYCIYTQRALRRAHLMH